MSASTKEPSRLSVYATLAGLALLITLLHETGASAWLRRTFEGWGLSPFGVNVLFGTLIGLVAGGALRAATLFPRWFGRREDET